MYISLLIRFKNIPWQNVKHCGILKYIIKINIINNINNILKYIIITVLAGLSGQMLHEQQNQTVCIIYPL